MKSKIKQKNRYRRHKRVRAKVFGTIRRPRLCVFRSNKHIYIQLINDQKGHTILSLKDSELKDLKIAQIKNKKLKEKTLAGKIAVAYEIGKMTAKKALKQEIKKIVFDKGGYKYHGRVKALAEGAREGGLIF